MKKAVNLYIGRAIISIVLIGLILIKIKTKILLETLSKINPFYIIILIIIYLGSLLIASLNIWILFKGSKSKISFKKIREMNFASWSLGLLIPGKVSEFTIPFMLKKNNIPIGKSMALVSVDFFISLMTILFIAIVGTIFILKQYLLHILIFGAILLTLLLIITNKRLINYLLSKNKKFNLTIKHFHKTIKILKESKKYVFINLVLSISKQFISALSILILFRSLDYNLSIFTILTINVIIIIVSAIPITINGLGLREGSAVLLYSLFNIPGAVVLGSYLIITTIGYLIGTFILFNNKNIKNILPNIKKLLKDGN